MLQLWATREFALRRNRSTRCRWDPHTYRKAANWLVIEPQQRSAEEEIKKSSTFELFFPIPSAVQQYKIYSHFWLPLNSLAKVGAEWIHFRWMGWRQEQKREQGKEPRQEKKVKLILITLFLANSFLFLAKCLSFQSLFFLPPPPPSCVVLRRPSSSRSGFCVLLVIRKSQSGLAGQYVVV